MEPTTHIDNYPIYNELYSLSCNVTGKPRVFTISWRKDGIPIDINDFFPQEDTDIQITDGPYDLAEGIHSALPWKPQGPEATCDTVTKFDGNYWCVAEDENGRKNSSGVISLVTRCE